MRAHAGAADWRNRLRRLCVRVHAAGVRGRGLAAGLASGRSGLMAEGLLAFTQTAG